MLTMGCGKSLALRSAGSALRDSVLNGFIAVGSSMMGDSSKCQNRESSLSSQALQEPITDSANTPRVGTLTLIGGMGVFGAYKFRRSTGRSASWLNVGSK